MTQRSIGSLMLLLIFPLLTACGKKMIQTHSVVFSQDTDLISPKVASAQCNAVADSGYGLSGAVTVYSDPHTGEVDDSKARIRLFQMPSVFTSNPEAAIQITRWGYEPSQGEVHDNQAAQIYVVLRSTGALLNPSQPLSEISQKSVAALLATTHLVFSSFFSNVDFVIPILQIQSGALTFTVSSSSATLETFSALVPTFAVNPNTYAQQIPDANLQVLHPEWALRQTGWSNSTFAYYFQEICRSAF